MRALGIVLENQNSNKRLQELTAIRSVGAMPMAGCFRAIDFSLSSMSASGISKVAVMTQYYSRSLQDHLSSSKWWDLGRKQGGLFIFTPYVSSSSSMGFSGSADAVYQNLTYLKRSNESYVIITSGDSIFKMNLDKLIDYHVQKEADVTMVYKKMPVDKLPDYDILELDENERVVNIEEKPLEPGCDNASLGIFCISRTLLMKYVDIAIEEGGTDLVRDIFARYRKRLNIVGCRFGGYYSNIGNGILDYYNANMDFLQKGVRDIFINDYPYVLTKPKDEPPAKYNYQANVKNSLIASGSIINGTVHDSIIFRRVGTGENTYVQNSIIMESSFIGNNCIVKNAIIDKEVVITDGKQITGENDKPIIIKKGMLL